MKVGITFDLKPETPREGPDDLHEEFDSPATIDAIAAVLANLGHEVVKLGDGRELVKQLLADPPDFVFNIAEGEGAGRSREARVPAVLELLGVPYTGSDPLTMAVTLDKPLAKRLVESAGVETPWGLVVGPQTNLPSVVRAVVERLPVIVKPAWEGSSKGIRGQCVVEAPRDLPRVVRALQRDYDQPILVEEYIVGDEVTVGIVGNQPPTVLGMMRVLPRTSNGRFVYSLEVKRDYLRQVSYEAPPKLPAKTLNRIKTDALKAFDVLGCRDVARVDFRVRDGVPYFLEVNPLPGLNPESSDLVILAKLVGWSHQQIVESIWSAANLRVFGTSQVQKQRSRPNRKAVPTGLSVLRTLRVRN
jgi:D-alanine-D-alanine ligase